MAKAEILIGRERKNPDRTPITYDWGTHIVQTKKTHIALIIGGYIQKTHEIMLSNVYKDCKRVGYEFGLILARNGLTSQDYNIRNGLATKIETTNIYEVEKVSESALRILESNLERGLNKKDNY